MPPMRSATPVVAIRIAAVAFGGACAGLGGAYISLVRVPLLDRGHDRRRGLDRARHRRLRRLAGGPRGVIGAYLFGGVTVLQLNLQTAGLAIPGEILSMSPYLITILVLVIISADRSRAALNAPAALGRTFHASS